MRERIDDILKNASLKKRQMLDLSHFEVDDEGARKLAHFLSENKILKRLHLSWNAVWTDGAQAIAKAISTNSSLEVLDLGHNSIQTEGAEHLAQALRENSTLKSMNLSDNNITDKGVKSLLDSLDSNSTLQKLDIEGNPIFDRELKQLMQNKLQRNSHKKEEPVARVTEPDNRLLQLQNELDLVKAQNTNMKNKIDKITKEHNLLKKQFTEKEKITKDINNQWQNSLEERIALEKSLVDISTKFEKEKLKVQELAAMQKSLEVLTRENQQISINLNALNAERRIIRQQNESLLQRVEMFSGSVLFYEKLEIGVLANLESQLEDSLNTIRTCKTQRMQKKIDDMAESRKCKVCFEETINTVLIPCGHHILCTMCGDKVTKCPVCNTNIQSKVHTYEC